MSVQARATYLAGPAHPPQGGDVRRVGFGGGGGGGGGGGFFFFFNQCLGFNLPVPGAGTVTTLLGRRGFL